MNVSAFSRDRFQEATEDELRALVRDLAEGLSRYLSVADEWDSAMYAVVEALRAVGHDLWSFDDSGDAQIWCADWTKPHVGGDLSLRCVRPCEVEVVWKRRPGDDGSVSITVGDTSDDGEGPA